MIKIGITGSLASGKTTASKIISSGRGPLFSADQEVKKLYKNKIFLKKITKIFKLQPNKNIKNKIKLMIFNDKKFLSRLEKLIHPLVRLKMKKFLKSKRTKIVCEIPLLIESKLMKNFDKIIFIDAKKSLRLKRYIVKSGNKQLFDILDKNQIKARNKEKFCDYKIVNNRSKEILKKNVLNIMKSLND